MTKAATHQPLPDPLRAALAQVLSSSRALRELTQEEVATRSHVSVQVVRRLEAGTSNPTLGTLYAVATTLETSVGDLLSQAGI